MTNTTTGRAITYSVSTVLVTEECCNCHILFAMPDEMQDRLYESHDSFYCPNGHPQSYRGESEEEKLRKKVLALEDSKVRLMRQRDEEAKAHRATKGQLTKARKRAANGVCPCCNRSFVDVARHVKTKHPGFDP